MCVCVGGWVGGWGGGSYLPKSNEIGLSSQGIVATQKCSANRGLSQYKRRHTHVCARQGG